MSGLSDAEREALTNYLEAAHDSGFALDDADLPRLLFRDGIAPLLVAREAEARRDERRKVAEQIAQAIEALPEHDGDGWPVRAYEAKAAAARIARAHHDPADARDDKEGR